MKKILIFTTVSFLDYLHRCNVLLIDGIFFMSPNEYEQLFMSMVIFWAEYSLSMVTYRKETKVSYNIILEFVECFMTKDLQFWITDFEQAQILVIKSKFPGTKTNGCYSILLKYAFATYKKYKCYRGIKYEPYLTIT